MVSSNLYDKATPVLRSPSMPVAGAQGKIVDVIHTEALGGASCVNQMLVTRGPPGDFDHWAALGHPSWDYKTMQPYFLKSEKSLSQTHSTWRGHSGLYCFFSGQPLFLEQHCLFQVLWLTRLRPFYSTSTASTSAWKEKQHSLLTFFSVRTAASALGFTDTSDFNASDVPVDVCAILDEAIDDSLRRVSSYNAFLPAELAYDRHQRLKICTKALATRIEFEDGVAVGVVFESSDKSIPGTFYARARKEIVVCSGAIGSPQLLLLRYEFSSFDITIYLDNSTSVVSDQRSTLKSMALPLWLIFLESGPIW
jgi:choline dehydrogenase-like flavoprotein